MTRFASKYILALTLMAGVFLVPATALEAQNLQTSRHPGVKIRRSVNVASEAFVRTELFFGTAREDLPPVSDEEWHQFLDSVITPRFPEGLTVYTAEGQFQDESGSVIKEKSFVLLLLYPLEEWKKRSAAIEFIREAYKDAYQQQSVLRVDDPFAVRVSF
jgi:hypothetical protein